jgi:LysM repeat protein
MNPQTITVAPHDTLTGIANSNKTTVQDLLAANPTIKNPDLIFSGTKINLPGAPVPTPDATKTSTGGAAPVADPNADPDAATKEAVAKELGYTDFNSFAQDTLQKPALDTEKLYNDAYSAQGLGDILKGITDKKTKLNEALGVVNDNPWYDEAYRRGQVKRLQDLAGGDIKNSEDLYNLKLGQVHDLVSREASDFTANETVNKSKLDYLHQRVSAAQTAQEKKDAAAAKVQTVSVGTNGKLYAVDPITHEFKLVATGNAPVTKATTGSTSPGSKAQQSLLAKFSADLTKINPKTETREALLARLIAKYGDQIDKGDIARKVMETYPDGWEGRYKKSSSAGNPTASLAMANLNGVDGFNPQRGVPATYSSKNPPSLNVRQTRPTNDLRLINTPYQLDEGGVPIPGRYRTTLT